MFRDDSGESTAVSPLHTLNGRREEMEKKVAGHRKFNAITIRRVYGNWKNFVK
jgi:hypothetical protein